MDGIQTTKFEFRAFMDPHSGPTPPHMLPMGRPQSGGGSGPPPQQGLPPMQPGGMQQLPPQHMSGGGYVPQGQGYDEWNHEWMMQQQHAHAQGGPPTQMVHGGYPPGHPGQHMHPQHPGMQPSQGSYGQPQPLVFNQNNPNAPPIFLCGHCSKEVTENDQPIQCEAGCKFWFHRLCSGLTNEAYVLLRQDVYAEWLCNICVQKAPQIAYIRFKA